MSVCPQCGFDLNANRKVKRVCCVCHQPILSHHKWCFNTESRVQHRCCEHPYFYSAEDAIKAREPKPAPLFDGAEEGDDYAGNVCSIQ